jgi:hypothetical protein
MALFLLLSTLTTILIWVPVASNTYLLPVPTSRSNPSPPAISPTAAPSSPQPTHAPTLSLQAQDGSTYWIRSGHHPRISYPSLADFPDVEIRVRYYYNRKPPKAIATEGGDKRNEEELLLYYSYVETTNHHDSKQEEFLQVDDCPRHFLWLSDQVVEAELQYRKEHGCYRERVLIEKLYFSLFYGGTGMASAYMDKVDEFQTELKGWNIMDNNRTTTNEFDHCNWEGVVCDPTNNTAVVAFGINGFSFDGTFPADFYHMSNLRYLDLSGTIYQPLFLC